MNERIQRMAEYVKSHDIYPKIVPTKYDPMDLFLPEAVRNAKRVSEFMLNQTVKVTPDDRMVGLIKFDDSTVSQLFQRKGHKGFQEAANEFYLKPMENLCTFEWQHSTANFKDVIDGGIRGYLDKIASSKAIHQGMQAETDFLDGLEVMCRGIIDWAGKCGKFCRKMAEEEPEPVRARELIEMAERIERVPENPCQSFLDAVQVVYFCFQFLPDSIGTPDRYLYPYYKRDIENGILTREQAKEAIQELFIAINGHTEYTSPHADKGAESHFSIGGCTLDGEDGFNDLSALILEAMMEMPIYRPQVSLRWTEKTPTEVLRRVLDYERHDAYKRIAVVNDEPRIRAFMNNLSVPYEDAINYTMVGCNEPAFQGSIWLGGNTANIARSLVNTLYQHGEELKAAESFDQVYAIYEKELQKDLERIMFFTNGFNRLRARDLNVLSTLFIDGSIEEAKSVTQGGRRCKVSGNTLIGITCVIDSLSILKQFVFEEKSVTMEDMLSALQNDWKGYEKLHTRIMKQGRFFGNNDPLSDEMSRRFTDSLYRFTKDKRGIFGERFVYGTLSGYNPHYAWFGAASPATPDGRYAGEPFMVGVGQTGGKDREGMTALLASIAQMDPHGILAGPFLCNLMLDEALIKEDGNFEKTVLLLEAYLKMGGMHFQLNYVSKEELLAAKEHPQDYKSLRVRVSGFSAYFVNLVEEIQNDVIKRTNIRS